jgi:hypothetical protein
VLRYEDGTPANRHATSASASERRLAFHEFTCLWAATAPRTPTYMVTCTHGARMLPEAASTTLFTLVPTV